MTNSNTPISATLADIVYKRAKTNGDKIAYTFLADGAADARSITWAQLNQRAASFAGALRKAGAAGQPVLLALPSGLGFVESLFACWYAGAIAVPVSLPRHQRVKHRLHTIVADAGARFAIGTNETRQRLDGNSGGLSLTAGLNWIDADLAGNASDAIAPTVNPQNVAFLQYTSGSTGTPRGVVVTHANVMNNSALIAQACGHRAHQTIAGWLPLFHDMGLVGLVLQAAFSGARCVFMSPERFLMRPRLWLQMISDYKVVSSPAPNFAYDLCVEKIDDSQKAGLDLSSWRNALNGSEPVRAGTLERFATAFAGCGFCRSAIFPCYGLAEATLFVTGPGEVRQLTRRNTDAILLKDPRAGGHVGCGRALGDMRIEIVDPPTMRRAPSETIGEIWLRGGSITSGYWKNAAATAAMFNARLDDTDGWLRTGDLGFIVEGELFITGRLRELIIVAGRNHFPVDLERTAETADPALAIGAVAAFSIEENGAERLVVAAELRREYTRPTRESGGAKMDLDGVCRRIRAAVTGEHEVWVHEIVLLRPGALQRTTSGKVSRAGTRDAYLAKTLELMEGPAHAIAHA